MTGRRPGIARRVAVLLFGGVLALAGCSGSSGYDPSQQMRAALLQLSDFPPTWRAYPQSANAGDLLGDIAVCTGAVKQERPVAMVQSSEFRNHQERITSTAVALNSNGDVSKRASSLGLPRATGCAARAAQQRVLDLLPGAKITSADFTVQPGGVNVAINYAGILHGVVNADVEGKATKVYVDAVFLLGTAFYSDITFLGVSSPVPDAIEHVLTDDVALREQHA